MKNLVIVLNLQQINTQYVSIDTEIIKVNVNKLDGLNPL